MRPPSAPRRPAGPPRGDVRPVAPVTPVDDPALRRGHDLVISDLDEEEELEEDYFVEAAPVRSIEPALAARDAARRRVLWVRLGIGAGACALLAALGWVVLYSPVTALDAQEISVSGGGTYVDAAAVVAAAATQEGTALLRVDTGAVQEQVEAMPGVAEVTVARAFPRGLTLEIIPREGVALVREGEESVQLVGSDGVVITTLGVAEAPAGLPILVVDMTMADAGTAVNEVLTVLAGMPEDLRAQVAEAGASGPRSVRLVLSDGAEVVWGSAQEGELKAAVLSTLLQVGASHYDVSEPGTPVTT